MELQDADVCRDANKERELTLRHNDAINARSSVQTQRALSISSNPSNSAVSYYVPRQKSQTVYRRGMATAVGMIPINRCYSATNANW